jgi:hypothetical protein
LIKAIEKKGPKAIQAAVETAAKAAKRRDSFAGIRLQKSSIAWG